MPDARRDAGRGLRPETLLRTGTVNTHRSARGNCDCDRINSSDTAYWESVPTFADLLGDGNVGGRALKGAIESIYSNPRATRNVV